MAWKISGDRQVHYVVTYGFAWTTEFVEAQI